MTQGPSPSMSGLVRAETAKLASRTSARLGLAIMVLIAVGVPLLMLVMQLQLAVSPLDPDVEAEPFRFDPATAVRMVLNARNFFVFRAMIIAVVAVSFAGEIVSRTLREDLVRPVSRAQVLAAKMVALQIFVALGTLIPLGLALPSSALLFGTDGLVDPVPGYLYTWLGDVGFATMVVAISLTLRSVTGTLGGVFLYWVVDQALGWALWAGAALYPFLAGLAEEADAQEAMEVVDRILAVRPWLPSSAFNLYWDVVPDQPFPWQSLISLVMITALSYVWASWRLTSMDVD